MNVANKWLQSDFIKKHGFSFKAYAFAVFLMPPMAILIALKMPGISIIQRGVGVAMAIATAAITTLGGGTLIFRLIKFVTG